MLLPDTLPANLGLAQAPPEPVDGSLLASPEDLALYMGRPPFEGADLDRARLLLAGASQVIKTVCQQEFVAQAYTEEWHQLQSVQSITLRQLPVVEVTGFTVNGVSQPAFGLDKVNGVLYSQVGAWGGLAVVNYTAGWASVPDDVRLICCALAARTWASPVQVRSEGIGGYNVSYGDPDVTLTWTERVALERYTQKDQP
jgi:hypothetical protein